MHCDKTPAGALHRLLDSAAEAEETFADDRATSQMATAQRKLGMYCAAMCSGSGSRSAALTTSEHVSYLERNRALPAEIVPEEEPDLLPALVADDAGKFQLAYLKRRLIDQKSKLKRKLEDPKAKPSKRQEWKTELAQCELKIQEIEFKLS